jgi:hypothetical protein
MALTKARRNEMFRAVAAGGLDSADCRLKFSTEDGGWRIAHARSRSKIIMQDAEGYYDEAGRYWGDIPTGEWRSVWHLNWQVANDSLERRRNQSWPGVIAAISYWAGKVVEYQGAPDLWKMRFDPELMEEVHQASGNLPFTKPEQAQVATRLRELKEYIGKTYELSAAHMSQVEQRLDEAEKASQRVGRKDWTLMFAGTVFTLLVSGIITPDIAQHMLMVVLHGLGHLFGLGGQDIHGTLNR